MTMQESRDFLKKIGMPEGDAFHRPTSNKRFPDGGQYRFEVFGVQNPTEFKALFQSLKAENLAVHRITQTQGIMQLTNAELKEMTALARENELELLLAVGPRASTDMGASIHTKKGIVMGNRLRGQEQIIRAMEDLKRGVKHGARYFLVYDEGSLWVFNKMREHGEIPADCHFKFSAHSGYGNPCSLKLIETLGANSVNPVWDMEISMLAAIREVVDIPMDIHVVTPKAVGGFLRYYEVPEIIRTAAPIYLKLGAINNTSATPQQKAEEKVRQAVLVREKIENYEPEAQMSPQNLVP